MEHTDKTNKENSVVIIGGGAAGLMLAGTLRALGVEPLVLEQGNRTGWKLSITGKGRCNVTNDSDTAAVIANIPTNPRFLYGALTAFGPRDTMELFEQLGVPLKVERGNRVFPVSDRAGDIVNALRGYAGKNIRLGSRAAKLITEEDEDGRRRISAVQTADGRVCPCRCAVIATGGKSYPRTGSQGDGYRLAASVGHTVIAPRPSLVPLEVTERWCARLQGLSLRNVAIRVRNTQNGSILYEDFGEMLFTHFGLSGPMILSASAHVRDMESGKYSVEIDLKPSLDEKTLDARLISDFTKYSNKNFSNALDDLLPKKLIPVIIELSGVSPDRKTNSLTKQERRRILELLKALTLTVKGTRPIDEAIITSGGVSVKEISPKTMESKLVGGLYFAGEVIDVDAYTGGFNLQIAFSTAVCAARAIAASL